jgi:23S rRNA pseudouridine2605 synthase
MGLARTLSKLGFCSRSEAIGLIRAGRVQVNGTVRLDPETGVRLEHDRISVNDRSVRPAQKIYLAVNKPRGLVTTTSDEKGRDTVYSVLAKTGENLPWVAPVGRLDKASEGLLLLTNDSEWGSRISSPDTHLEKTYHVQLGLVADDALVQAIVHGVRTDGLGCLRATKCSLLRSGDKNSWIEIRLDEGKNRQIRRMLRALGVEVLRLVRISIGPLQLGTLAKGMYRRLTADEKRLLDRALTAESGHAKAVGVLDSGFCRGTEN